MNHVWWGAKTIAGQRRYDNKASLLRRLCGLGMKSKVLEVGCGDGEFTKRLLRLFQEVTAIDVTPGLIKRARENHTLAKADLRVSNAEKLDFPDGSFDLVCGVSILHHIDALKALKEAYRVLKIGGSIFFTEPNILNPHVFLGLSLPCLREKMEFSPDETAFTRWQIAKILDKTKFGNPKVMNYDFLHPWTPEMLIGIVERLGGLLEKTPFLKEISGSLVIFSKK